VAERLRAAGHRAVCVTLPGTGEGEDPSGWRLQDAVDHIVGEVERLDTTDVILVAHSWGAYPMTGAAHRLVDKVSKVVFYSAFVPVPGGSMVEDNYIPEGAAMLRRLIAASPNRAIAPPVDAARGDFMQDVADAAQRLVAERLTPLPGNYFLDRLDAPPVTELGIPALYILSEDDHTLPWPGTEYAARLGLEPVMVPGTHEGLLTHPDEVAKAILNG
jgi:pimeloyl-ACP methyl ester carboxylesterase